MRKILLSIVAAMIPIIGHAAVSVQPGGGSGSGTASPSGADNSVQIKSGTSLASATNAVYLGNGTLAITNAAGEPIIRITDGTTIMELRKAAFGNVSGHDFDFLASDTEVWTITSIGNFEPSADSSLLIGSPTVRPAAVYSDIFDAITNRAGTVAASNLFVLPFSTSDPSSDGGFLLDTNGTATPILKFYYNGTVFYLVGTTNAPGDNEIPKYDAANGRFAFEADSGAGGSPEGEDYTLQMGVGGSFVSVSNLFFGLNGGLTIITNAHGNGGLRITTASDAMTLSESGIGKPAGNLSKLTMATSYGTWQVQGSEIPTGVGILYPSGNNTQDIGTESNRVGTVYSGGIRMQGPGTIKLADGLGPVGGTIYATNSFWSTNLSAHDTTITLNMGTSRSNVIVRTRINPSLGYSNCTFSGAIIWEDGTTTQPILPTNALSYVTFIKDESGRTNGIVSTVGWQINYGFGLTTSTNPWNRTITVPIPNTKHYEQFGAASFLTNTTEGATYGTREHASGLVAYDYLAFAGTGTNSAQVSFFLPQAVGSSDFKVKISWTTTNAIALQTNVWGVAATWIDHDDTIAGSFGTEVLLTQNVTAADDMMVTSSGTVTPSGSVSDTSMMWLRVRRRTDSANDQMDGEARLVRVWLEFDLAGGSLTPF